jgi:histidyl-tRNA synthetase
MKKASGKKIPPQAPKGMKDLIGKDFYSYQGFFEKSAEISEYYGFRAIETPILENTELFISGVGEGTDIVEKEMYTFTDRGGRSIALRPEATASIVRAFLEHHLDQQGVTKLFYSGPMFRGEKPQAGRNRQFYQIGVEALGSMNPILDAEVILCAVDFLRESGLKNFKLLINTVGTSADKMNFSALLKSYLNDKRELLCESCRQRYDRNVLRMLDCKISSCQKIIEKAPTIMGTLGEDSRRDFEQVERALKSLSIPFNVTPNLVRGLDYYTKTVFEIVHESLGAQNTVLAGGRYDNLIAELGGAPAGAIGFALGVERLLLALAAESAVLPVIAEPMIYAIGLGEDCFREIFKIAGELRRNALCVFVNFESRSLKAQLRQADKLGCPLVLILGVDEFNAKQIQVKDMRQGTQEMFPLNNIVALLRQKLRIPHAS